MTKKEAYDQAYNHFGRMAAGLVASAAHLDRARRLHAAAPTAETRETVAAAERHMPDARRYEEEARADLLKAYDALADELAED